MSWNPIASTVPQYMDANGDPYSGAVLKFYAATTSTNIVSATDPTGGTTQTDVVLNANGNPAVSGSTIIPHIDRDYKLSLYPSQAAADSNTGSIWSIDNLSASGSIYANVTTFGAVGDGVTDDTTAIQTAIDSISTTNGGTVYFPGGKYLITSTIMVTTDSIQLLGEGGNYFFQNSAQNRGTILKWGGGASSVVKVISASLTRPIVYPRLTNISIDGSIGNGAVATTGLEILSCTQGVFENVSVSHCVTEAVRLDNNQTPGYTGLILNHSCTFRNLGIDQVWSIAAGKTVDDGDGLVIDGNAVADENGQGSTTVCGFYETHIRIYNGDGCRIQRGDNNIFYKLSVGRPSAGTGRGIVFGAVADGFSCNQNAMFYALAGEGGVICEGTETAALPSVGNSIYGLSIDIDNPLPVVGTNSNLYYHQLFDAVNSSNTYGQNRVRIVGDYFDPIQFNGGSHNYGINFVDGSFSLSQIRLKNNTPITSRNNADTADIEVFRVSTADELQFYRPLRLTDGDNISFGTTTGTKLGNTASQKMGFWGTTAVVQPAAVADATDAASVITQLNDLLAKLRTIGLIDT